MRIVVCLKHVPVMTALRFDPESKRLVREGVRGEPSAFDVRALLGALAAGRASNAEVVAVSMGPPDAAETLRHALALGAHRAVHLLDGALAGSDTLATARALAAVVQRERADVVLTGRASVDAETGQVGPEVAELLGWPQATVVRRIALHAHTRTFEAERETDEGFETVAGPLPVVLTAAEDLSEERFPSKAERQAAAERAIETISLADVALGAEQVGQRGSPTWVADIEQVTVTRRGELLQGEDPAELARRLGERLRELGALAAAPARRPLPARAPGTRPPIWVVADIGPHGPRTVTAELLAKANELAAPLDAAVEAVVLGAEGARHADALAAAGADRVLVADAPWLEPYTTDAHAAVLTEAIRTRGPRLVLLASTVRGRDLAPRVAARLGLGLTGDAIDLDVDAEGRVRQLKPAFGGSIVAPILSRTRPEMATVRPGMLHPGLPQPDRRAEVVRLAVTEVEPRVRVLASHPLADDVEERLDAATIVFGVGKGIGGVEGLPAVQRCADALGAAICATREVTDLGWLPRQYQVGLTGRAIAPQLYVGLGISGSMEHMVGLKRAGTIVAINKSPKAPVFKGGCDVGVIADLQAILPHLGAALRA